MTTPLSFLEAKGGTGKTVATGYFATVLHSRGFAYTVVDADHQGNATVWRSP